MIRVTIDGNQMEFEEVITVWEAAKRQGIDIPTLCHHEKLTPYGGCRVCLVEASTEKFPDRSWLIPACSAQIEDGTIIETASETVKEARIFVMELLLSRCPESEELRQLAIELGVPLNDTASLDIVGDYLLNRAPKPDETKCILCGLCVRACAEIPERHAINFEGRSAGRKVKTPFDMISDTCIGCGSCAFVCPTNTITIDAAV